MAHHTPTVLHLDLANQSFEVRTHEDLAPWVGGLGWALALLEEYWEEDPIVFAIGPLSGIIPGCSKTIAVFRSPQNGFLTAALGGGHLARSLRFAGYQAVVIKGVAEKPVVINLDKEQALFKDGAYLMNKETGQVFDLLLSSEGVPGQRSVLATGLAAEQGITFSSLYIDEFFAFPRGGLGTAFSQRRLKGLVVSGSGEEDLGTLKQYEEIFSLLLSKVRGFEELERRGTLKNLEVERKISGVPFENLNEPNFEDQNQLVESFTSPARLSCDGCPVGCLHLVLHDKNYIPYDFESVVALGPLLGLTSKEEVVQLLSTAYRVGLDPTSLGVILAYLTEKEKLSFGDVETYLTLVDAFLDGKEDWAKALGLGLDEGVKQLGGAEFALTLGGMEFLPYFNGYASILSQALSLSATTEENRGFLLDLDLLKGELDPALVVTALVAEEKKKILSQLLIGCGYLSLVFEETATAFAALEGVGAGVGHEELEDAVKKIFAQKLSLQKRSGFNPHHVKIPARFFSVPSPHGLLEEGKLRQMIKIYCENYFDAQP